MLLPKRLDIAGSERATKNDTYCGYCEQCEFKGKQAAWSARNFHILSCIVRYTATTVRLGPQSP